MEFAINLFEDNGHDRALLEKIAKNYQPPDVSNKKQTKKSSAKNQKDKNASQDIPENLFDILPFRESELTEEEFKPYVVMTYLPDGVFHQMKRACTKAGVQLITRPGTKLKNLLCAPNRTHHEKTKKTRSLQNPVLLRA